MRIGEYIHQALRSEQPLERITGDRAFVALSIEVLIAAGALADLLKKQLVYGKPIDRSAFNSALELVKDCAETAAGQQEGAEALIPIWPRMTHAALGGYGEYAELLEALLEGCENNKLDTTNVIEEVGDISWYGALALDELNDTGLSRPDLTLAANIAKLKARYPDKFTLEASEARDTDAEMAAIRGAA
ncbi:MAG TPA: hypothetical protein PKV98_04410 [Burkholderiaceae bacterium]|nr:hypothetical protein [Burkholderiaceae bacterium]